MKSPFSSPILALLVAAILPLVYASESPSLLLQKGIYAEEIERNLDSAIKIYEQIGAEAAANRSVAAQAQYRLAVCYQKKGDKAQAIRLLNELVQQPPGDPSLSQKARATLTKLGVAPSEAVSVRRIPLSGNPGWIVAVSADGRLVGYQPWDSNELFVQDLTTGKTQLVAQDAAMRGHSPPARFSPDGQWIAYDYQEAGIHIAKSNGTEVRKLLDLKKSDGKGHWNEIAGWSADGAQVIMAQWDGTRNCRIAVALDAKTGVAKEMAAALNRGTDQWRISDDSRYTLCLKSGYPRAITLLDFKTNHEESVLAHDAVDIIGWAAGDTKLIYSKKEIHGVEIWAVDVQGGQIVGKPRLVASDFIKSISRGAKYAEPLGVAGDGRIFYTVEREKPAASELWVLEGFLLSKSSNLETEHSTTEIPPDELTVGADRSLLDRKLGLSATIPTGWSINAAHQSVGGDRLIMFLAKDVRGAIPVINYNASTSGPFSAESRLLSWTNALGPRPTKPTEVDAWLRSYAQRMGPEDRLKQSEMYAAYENRPASIALRTIGRNRAVSWIADFTRSNGEKDWVECVTVIYGEKAVARIRIQAKKATIDTIRPAFETLVESVRLP